MSAWIVTSYELSTEVLITNDTYSAERLAPIRNHLPAGAADSAKEILKWLDHWMVFRDPPDHTRLRRHMATVLNAGVFETLRDSVRDITRMLIRDLPKGETFDFVKDFSILLPGMVIMDLFGIDRSRLLEVKGWSDDMMLFIGSSRGVENKYERAKRGAREMGTLFQDLVAQRREEPNGDILSQLIQSKINGEGMSDEELVGSMMMVLNGGHETTANLLNNSMLALAQNPDQAKLLLDDHSLVPSAVEEFLRYDSPVLSLGRIVTEDVELGDKLITKGERVFTMLLAANRDEDIFDNPDRLDITRQDNPHMAFGKGGHFCMGGPLARIEAQVAFEELLQHFNSIELQEDVSNIPWINSMVTRGPTRLPIKLK
jgi:cytochrome P450